MSSSDALLRTDSLSGTDPALSDGSVGSAPSLGLSPGTPGVPDIHEYGHEYGQYVHGHEHGQYVQVIW